MDWRNISIASRLALWTLLGSALVLTASGAVLFKHTRDALLAHTNSESRALAQGAASSIQARLERVVVSTQQLAGFIDAPSLRSDELLHEALESNRDLSGLALAFPPVDGKAPPAIFVSQDAHGDIRRRDLRYDSTHYWQQTWFLDGMTCRHGCWQRAFFSKSRKRWLINYSVAIVRHGKAKGLVNADVALDWLQDILGALDTPAGAEAFVMGGSGTYLANDQRGRVGTSGNPSLLKVLAGQNGKPVLLSAGHGTDLHDSAWLYHAPIKGTHWTLGLLVPQARIYAPMRRLFITDFGIGMLALLCIAIMLLLVTRRTLAPLTVLTRSAEHIARGETEFELPAVHGHDEIGRLTSAFDTMRKELAEHIAQLTEAVRMHQRLASELEIAHQIQTSLLPKDHFVDARTSSFELHAALRPARAVGGDLYSYFMLDKRRFCVMVGDVSDKGIPAALFMARTITLAKALAAHTHSPPQILARLNSELCVGNDSCMFVTLLCGVLDLGTGRFTFASAGHDPLILANADGTRLVETDTGAAIGLDEDATYPSHRIQLQPGDTLMLYTDGITEATNAPGDMYGIERALEVLDRTPPAGNASEFTQRLLADLDHFVGDADQADDITVLTLNWLYPAEDLGPDMFEMDLPSKLDEVMSSLDRCDEALAKAGVSDGVREDIRLVLEELMVNMVEHGHAGKSDGHIQLHVECFDDDVQVSLRDNGKPFNPLDAKQPSLDEGLADPEQVGGFGIHLVRAMASDLKYSHDHQGNHLQLRFARPSRMEPEP